MHCHAGMVYAWDVLIPCRYGLSVNIIVAMYDNWHSKRTIMHNTVHTYVLCYSELSSSSVIVMLIN